MNGKAYDIVAKQWDEYRKKMSINTCIVEFEKTLKPKSRILDIGCGSGYPIAKYLDEKNHIVTGIDISKNMIEIAKELKLSKANFILSDICDFESKEKFDCIIAFDSLFHINNNKQEQVYKKIASFINPGGYFLFTHGNKKGSIIGEMFGEKFYYSALNTDEVLNILSNNGFEVIKIVENYREQTTGDRDLFIIAVKK